MGLLDNTFITIGTSVIRDELLIPVQRPFYTYSFKPRKGLWASIYHENDDNVCDWLKFLKSNELYNGIIFKKATLFKLKSNANICTISTIEDVQKLSAKYPSLHHKLDYYDQKLLLKKYPINYETLSDDYDGIYIQISSLPEEMVVKGEGEFHKFDCDSLLLSNAQCIEYYRSAELIYAMDKIKLKVTSEPTNILPRNETFDILLNQIRELAISQIGKFKLESIKSYKKYWEKLEDEIKYCANMIYFNNENEFQNLDHQLQCNGLFPMITIMEEIILSEQLREADKNIFTRYLKK